MASVPVRSEGVGTSWYKIPLIGLLGLGLLAEPQAKRYIVYAPL